MARVQLGRYPLKARLIMFLRLQLVIIMRYVEISIVSGKALLMMADFKIEELVSLLDKGSLTKDELVVAMDKIQFQPFTQELSEFAIPAPISPAIKSNSTLERYSLLDIGALKGSTKDVIIRESTPSVLSYKDLVDSEVLNEMASKDSSTKKDSYKTPLSKELSTGNVRQFASENNCDKERVSLESPIGMAQSEFLSRLERYNQQKNLKLKEGRLQLNEREGKECSFHPKTNIRKNKHTQSAEDIGSRLYSDTKRQEAIDRIRSQQKLRTEAELATTCTFCPAVNPKRAKSRYMEEAQGRNNLKEHWIFSASHAAANESEYTFRPGINKRPINTYQAKDGLSSNAYTRLSQSNSALKRLRRLHGACASQENLNIQKKECGSVKQILDNFFKRQHVFEQRKEENKCKLINKVKIKAIPVIDKNSEKIAKALNVNTNIHLHRTDSCTIKASKALDREHTFRPNILPKSKEADPRTIDEMIYKAIARKEESVDRLRKEAKSKERKECTFKPEINKAYEDVRSKLQLKSNIKTYTARIKLQKDLQNDLNNICKRIKDYKEMKECTHEPEITKHPYCIKEKKIVLKESTGKKLVGSYSKKHLMKK
eukprot:TRINITY_DN6146_c0_g2_i3.p1 TRINITY_DN6146_c0_g2~~TRINITY_DN6146_c0_g2_i3.p1  ORF type:complete len:600 (+),score=113.56 TRINITY_DN6146_c0_g2_i3:816-2615(+)